MKDQPILQPHKIGDLSLPNRAIMAPMTRSRAVNDENAPTDLHVEYYTQRATAGLIITEGAQVSKQAVGYIHTAGIHSKAAEIKVSGISYFSISIIISIVLNQLSISLKNSILC